MDKNGAESELLGLQKRAEQLAERRKERVTSAHLLAAMAGQSSNAAVLLHDRRLGAEDLLRAARAATDDERDPLRLALRAAREVATRMRAPHAEGLHLLVALLGDRRTAAYRALDQSGVDVGRLRLCAMNQALGLLGRQPLPGAAQRARPRATASARAGAPKAPPGRTSRGATSRRRAELVSPQDQRDRLLRSAKTSAQDATQPNTQTDAGARSTATAPRRNHAAQSQSADATFALPAKKFPLLERLGRNLTLAASRGELDEVVCRDAEVEQVLDVLCQRFANSPCLVGPSGVGKTRIVHGLARRLARAEAPRGVEGRVIVELSASALLLGTGVRGGIAQRMAGLRKELEHGAGRVVLFFDDLQQVFSGEGGDELASEFKLMLAHGQLPCIGATTREEYARVVEADPALSRRFSVVEVEEPSREDAFLMLSSLVPKFEAHHQIKLSDEALALAISWSVQYVSGRALPDKAVSIVDAAGARARRRALSVVGPEQVAEVVSELSGVPCERLLERDGDRMLVLEQSLAARVVGHGDALSSIARAVRRNAVGFGGKRPIGTFLLLGPTGVGKTETAKALAEALFFSEHAMTRIDLSEYSEAHAVARLIGAPPGYVGHDAGGQLTEAVRRRPYQVILLDELEKAHSEVLTSFLALFDEARMTDGRGRTVDFSHTLIVMTSNLGASEAPSPNKLGFQRGESGATSDYGQRLVRRARETLAPELFNRIDDVLVFAPLERDQIREIAERSLAKLARSVFDARGVEVRFGSGTVECLLGSGGVDLTLGARPMRRTIAKLIEAPLSDLILRGELESGDRVTVRGGERGMSFTPDPRGSRTTLARAG